jgi:hypothetical protein
MHHARKKVYTKVVTTAPAPRGHVLHYYFLNKVVLMPAAILSHLIEQPPTMLLTKEILINVISWHK